MVGSLRPIMKIRFLLTLLLAFGSVALAQTGHSVRGILQNPEGQALPFVNLALRKSLDSTVVKIGVSDDRGAFRISGFSKGNYYLETSMPGFRRLRRKLSAEAEGEEIDLGIIQLEPADVQLKEVAVYGTKPFIKAEPDKLVVQVDNNPLMVNNNALEVLKKSPNVMVNQDDQIFLQGKSGLVVYVDGKPSPLQEKDLANWLRGIPSSQIELIEIITQPSARYDAAGNAGIINIRLKKNQKKGINGNLNSSIGHGLFNEHNYLRTSQGFGLNLGLKKVNVYSNYAFDHAKSWSFMDFKRSQSDYFFDQTSNTFDTRNSHTVKLGVDWFVNRRHSIGIAADGNFAHNQPELDGNNLLFTKGASRPYALLESRNLGDKQTNSGNVSLNHSYRDSTGREWSSDASYGFYTLGNRTQQPNFYRNYVPDSSIVDRSFGLETPVTIGIKTIKTDFEQPLAGFSVSLGGKFSDVETDNVFEQFDRSGGGNRLDTLSSSQFRYHEQVLAFYGILKRKLGKDVTISAGLRYEGTRIRSQLSYYTQRVDSNSRIPYDNFFPSGGISWQASKNHSLSLNYSRRIDRPVYRFLNPFQFKIDELSFEQGNPYLKPQYTDNLQLTYAAFGMATASLGYSNTQQFFARVIDSLGKQSFLTRRNLAEVSTWSFNLSSPLPIRKWWNGFFTFGMNRQLYEANLGEGKNLKLEVSTWNLYMQHSFRLPGQMGLQVSGSYNSPNVWGGTFRNRAFWFCELGINRKLFQNKATISLNISDIFLSQRWKGESDFGGVDMTVWGGNDSRNIRLGFSWLFGKEEPRQSRKKAGNTEERQRLRGE